jgi:hypothetical protein
MLNQQNGSRDVNADTFYDNISNSDAYSCLGMPEIASIYQSEEERD